MNPPSFNHFLPIITVFGEQLLIFSEILNEKFLKHLSQDFAYIKYKMSYVMMKDGATFSLKGFFSSAGPYRLHKSAFDDELFINDH